jgi:hypothetical protein
MAEEKVESGAKTSGSGENRKARTAKDVVNVIAASRNFVGVDWDEYQPPTGRNFPVMVETLAEYHPLQTVSEYTSDKVRCPRCIS